MKEYHPTHTNRASTIAAAILITLCWFGAAQRAAAIPPPAGVAPVLSPEGGFALDGSVLANVPVSGTGDWVTNSSPGGGVLTRAGVPLNAARTFHFVDPYNGNDLIFSGGLKWTDSPNAWKATGGKAGGKTDINNVLLHIANDAEGHSWLIISADRYSTSGDSYIDFEFLQNSLVRSNDNKFYSTGLNGGRTTNDLVLSLAFVNGGSTPDFSAWRWMASGGGFAYVDVTASLPAGRVFLAASGNNTPVPYGAFGSTNYSANAFAEAAVDLTALLAGFDPCKSFGFKTIMVKTKSSASSSASIDDFIDPIQYNLRIGPGADAGPDQTRCSEDAETSFPLNGVATPGLSPISSKSWSIVSGDVSIDDTNSLVTTARVSSGSAVLRLTVVQSNGCVEADDMTLTVQQPPVCAIMGVTNTCPRSTNTFSAPAGMNVYSWSVTGNGAISGPANQQTVQIVAGSLCGTGYSVSLTASTNVCTVSCNLEVAVVDTGAPVLTCPPDRVLDCPAVTTTNVTGVATATDSCSRVMVAYSDEVTPGCAGTRTIARTWTATDECGNSVSCTQNITVRDITPPVIVCPTNRTLEFPANTTPANTGLATATDTCGSASVGFADTITTNCGNTFTISRLWTATDECGNRSTCNQTITVRDTTAPVITCPADVTLECPSNTSTNNTGVATASDAGGAINITFSDSVSNFCGVTQVIKRTWTARDACNNQSSCTQTITVRDTTPPVLTCPAEAVLQCPADTSTNNTGVATAVDACGAATITYSDSVTNLCGNTKVIARTWRATDVCSNQTSCIQIIRVVDTTPPVITCVGNKTIQCGTPWSFDPPTASDTCGTNSIAIVSTTTNATCGNTFIATRTWRATDACGNQATCSQAVTVIDTTPPVITCPVNVTLECPAVTTTNATGVATATDNCGSVTITFSDSNSTICGNARTISRTWRATDLCGNFSTCVQTITVRDTAPPTITPPANVIVECGSSTAPAATGTATSTDACNSVTVTFSDSVSNSCGGTRIISRRWLAMDSCNNSNSAVQTITVRDTTPPALTLPANRVLDCPANTSTNSTGVATATDVCGSVTIFMSEVVSNSCGGTKTIWRTWAATDQCGNSTNGVQSIVVRDITAPSFSCRAISVQCVEDVPPPYLNLAAFIAAGGTASDSCDPSLDFELVSDSGLVGRCPGRVTRVYRVTDDCGNTSQCSQVITVSDTIAPTLTCPPSVTIECGSSLDPSSLGTATATDNCSTNIVITNSDAIVDSSYNLKWYASDPDSGTGPYLPTYLKFGPGSLACPGGGRANDPLRNAVAFAPNGQLDALTSMGNVPMSFGQIVPFQLVIEASGGPGTDRGTIEFTSAWSTYTTSNNRFGYDTNYMVYCAFVDPADPGSIDPHFNARVESYSSTVVNRGTSSERIQGTFRVSGIDSGDRIIVEVWVVLMSSMPGNTGGTVAADLVSARKMSTPPQDISIGNQTVSLGNLNKIGTLPPPQSQPPAPSIPPQPSVPPGATVSIIDRTWSATDECGNRRTCVQRITVRDTVAPTISCAPDRNVTAGQSWNFDTPTASDTCGSTNVQVLNSVTNVISASTISATRTWVATDGNGNSNTCSQTITVSLPPPPVITAEPQGQSVPLGDNISLNVNAAGMGPISYQWQKNDMNIPGATNSALNLANAQFNNAGTYRALASNAGGSATSAVAVVNVAATLQNTFNGNLVTLTWASPYVLQWSTIVSGPYVDVPGASSPFTYNLAGPPRYFRLRMPALQWNTSQLIGGEFHLGSAGVPGCNFIIEASTNLVHWVNLSTNPCPIVFVDSNAWQYPKRFYRAIPAY